MIRVPLLKKTSQWTFPWIAAGRTLPDPAHLWTLFAPGRGGEHISMIDKQRIAAVEILTNQGYRFRDAAWTRCRTVGPDFEPHGMMADADAIHALLMLRADALAGCAENSEEAAELDRIVDTVDRYEAKHWPQGRADGGKG